MTALHWSLGLAAVWLGLSRGGPLGGFGVWLGLTGIAVGFGYAGLGARIFGKDARGAHAWLPALLLAPYRGLCWLLWQGQSRLRPEPSCHEVAEGLLLGRRPLRENEVPDGIHCVVDLTSEFPRSRLFAKVPSYVTLPTLDMGVPADGAFRELVERLADERGTLYVHCAMGHGRAPTLTAALLIARGLAADADDAIDKLRAIRPTVHLHGSQRALLERFAATR